ncbi:MAG: glycoside hydrolase family 95 protein [Candidatus Pseudobacter hemicellulosilyticus]|uniref:Glycoside hydrolase family 95 protein n=1 Tax=Candidatus Pseudobacter hemicellulosilyticus TaxID=3121375 RepID=A0AAJ6BGQ8_9BACT|nr:MAG: glycoside hydrolase family 95 protein [Pseudobacter sp.]
MNRLSAFFLFLLLPALAFTQTAPPSDLLLWDNKPATDWMTQAYPIGNGRIGGMVFGGIHHEQVQFNEQSLWTGDQTNTGAYQAFGDLHIWFTDSSRHTSISKYRRQLDISQALHTITYSSNNIDFKREYFCSAAGNHMALRFTASKPGAYSMLVALKDAHKARTTAKGARLTIEDTLENGMKYHATLLIRNEGGQTRIVPDGQGGYQLKIDKANACTFLLIANTNFSEGCMIMSLATTTDMQLSWQAKHSYASQRKDHIEDYQELFGRVNLSLGNNPANNSHIPTLQRLINYKKTPDPQLEALLFQYGRYLLISSSRSGGQPANLQGIWNNSNNPPWRSDYHSNINIQMNYWLAEPTNLAECHTPYLEFINRIREVKKKNTQTEFPGVRGWTVRTENNIFGGESWKWNTPGSAWFTQALWEHYAFNRDTAWLKNFAYPILEEIVQFWEDRLKERPDGTLVCPMGWSPEHGPEEDGVSHDQQIVYDLFTNFIEACDALGIHKIYRDRIANMRERLLKPAIGRWGQLQEWETDRDDPKDQHRHVSQLFGLHPGRQFSITRTPALAEAARVSLQARGDASTGWSMAWKMNFWARLHDGNHAYTILKNFINLVGAEGIDYNDGGGIYGNLFCSHPPFQIDGNFGYTAGVAEMLIQSQTGEIELLPALPDAWSGGRVSGLKARGNFLIRELQWENKQLRRLELQSLSGVDCIIRSPNALTCTAPVTAAKDANGYTYRFRTKANSTYTFLIQE